MPRLKVAHVNQQGVDLIIVPLDRTFGQRTQHDQRRAINELQMRSNAAGLRGSVVPVWDTGGGRMAFIAPPNWHSFFRNISLRWVAANVNREVHW